MGILDFVKGGVTEFVIARPDAAKGHWICKYPSQNIPWKAQLTVNADDLAMFFKNGRFVGLLPPGRHTLDSNNIPFLGQLSDRFSGGSAFVADLYFVSAQDRGSITFATQVGDILDRQTGMRVKLMVRGECSTRVFDPKMLGIGCVGAGVQSHDAFLIWFKGLVEREIAASIAATIAAHGWPVLQVSSGAYKNVISMVTMEALRKACENYGLDVVGLGDFTTRLDPSDMDRVSTSVGRGDFTTRLDPAELDRVRTSVDRGAMPGVTAKPPANPAAAQSPARVPNEQVMAMLTQLGELKAAGILTQAEYDAKKAELLTGQ